MLAVMPADPVDVSASSARSPEERLRLATEDAGVAVWEYDFLAGAMTRTANHDGLYGIPPQAVWTYDTFMNATHVDDRARSNEIVQAACAPGGADHYAFDFRVVTPAGEVRWLAVTGHVAARDARGAATLVRGALVDVTRRKLVEVELRAAVRARDEFLQVAGHELRTPLALLTLKLGKLRRDARRGALADAEEHLAAAEAQTSKLGALVDGLLEVGRWSAGTPTLQRAPVPLADLAREVVDACAPQAQRAGCAIDVDVRRTPVGSWDRARIEQVLLNLVGNAMKYGAGKPVQIVVDGDDAHGRLVVADRGIGIDAAVLPRIFEKFERGVSTHHYGGLGLGLYVAREIVAAHGGRIEAKSAPGEGTTFVVDLPLSSDGA